MLKKENGITVTVLALIILFFLVGIIISFIASKNPILKYSSVAVTNDRIIQAKEEIRIAYVKTQYGYWKEWEKNNEINKEEFFIKDNRFEKDIKSVSGKIAEIHVIEGENEVYVVYKALDTNEIFNFKIDSNGNISEKNK